MAKVKENRPAPLVEAQKRREPVKPAPMRKPAVSALPTTALSNGGPSRMHDAATMLSSSTEGSASARAQVAASMQRSLGNARMSRMMTPPVASSTAGDTKGVAITAVPEKAASASTLAVSTPAPAVPPAAQSPSHPAATAGGTKSTASHLSAGPSTNASSARAGTAPSVAAAPAGKAGKSAATRGAGHAVSAGTAAPAAATGHESGATGGAKHAARHSPHEAIAPTAGAIHHRATVARKHSGAGAAVGAAQAAGIKPDTEQARSSAAQTVENLNDAKTDGVDPDGFKAKLKEAIRQATPQPTTESQADKLMKSGAKDASAMVSGHISAKSTAAAEPMKAAEADAPTEKPPAAPELKPEAVGAPPAPVAADSVVPAPLPPEQLDYSSDREPTDRAMTENKVTKEQLAEGNEPQFGSTLSARSSAESHEAAIPAQYRKSEASVQDQAHHAAQQQIATGLTSMHGVRGLHITKVAGRQSATVTKNLAERQRITDTIAGIRNQTRTDVEAILKSMERGAVMIFEPALLNAERAFEDVFEDAKGGVGTWLTTWGSDWEELIRNSLDKARNAYLALVEKAVDDVAKFVEDMLKAARARVAEGRKQVQTFVNGLDASVKHFGEEALQTVSADFDAMGGEIDQRRDALVNKLTEQYKASYDRMSAMEEKLREENKSLWQRVYDATVGVIKQILAFKDMLLSVLAKAASVVGDIIAHPIRFLGNLVSGVMQGLKSFMSHIGTHLLKGLMEWLFGALAGAGLQLPDSFDLKGIVSIVLQILGLTYANFRSRAVAIVGEPVVAGLEKVAGVIQIVMTKGISGLWEFIKEKVSDLKSMVLDAIFDFIKEKVIIAGITWIIGLLNPASAFFKACKAIYDIISFFINRGSQILALVNAVLDSVAAIAQGAIGIAATAVENALAKAIPVAIGFLASLLGLGDISGTIKKTIDKAQAPVNKAIDWVINTALKAGKGLLKMLGLGGKEEKDRKSRGPDNRTDQQKQEDLQAAINEGQKLLESKQITEQQITASLGAIKAKYKLKSILVIKDKQSETEEIEHIRAEINPVREGKPTIRTVVRANHALLNRELRALAHEIMNAPAVLQRLHEALAHREAGKGRSPGDPRLMSAGPGIPAEAALVAGMIPRSQAGLQRKPFQREYLEFGGSPFQEIQTYSAKPGHIITIGAGTYENMAGVGSAITGRGATGAQAFGGALAGLLSTGTYDPRVITTPSQVQQMAQIARVSTVEMGRNITQVSRLPMILDVMQGGGTTINQALVDMNPMAARGAVRTAQFAEYQLSLQSGKNIKRPEYSSSPTHQQIRGFVAAEESLIVARVQLLAETKDPKFEAVGDRLAWIRSELQTTLNARMRDFYKV